MNAFANPGGYAAAYKQQQVTTASPEQLTLMLYSGAVRFVSQNIKSIEEDQMAEAHTAHLRVQDILLYLIDTLDMQYEISHNLYQLYDYLIFRLNEANLKKDLVQMEEARELLAELRDTWNEAMKKTQSEKGTATGRMPGVTKDDQDGAVRLTLASAADCPKLCAEQSGAVRLTLQNSGK